MNETIKSLVRHLLTAIGTILVMFGLTEYSGIVDLIAKNLDAIISAVSTLIGVIMAIAGFFKESDRHEIVSQYRVAQMKAA